MAKFQRVCGSTIRTSGDIPHLYQWNLLLGEAFDELPEIADVDRLYLDATVMFKCPRSEHLWIYWNGLDASPTLYSPTEPDGLG